MRKIMFAIVTLMLFGTASALEPEGMYYQSGSGPNIDVWTNKGNNSTYYFGEDVAVYFRADRDCYAVVYDIDPSGQVNVLYPSGPYGSCFVEGDKVYRVPDYNDDFKMEVSDNSGNEHIFAVASYDHISPPDFIRYINYDYGNSGDYDDNYFVLQVRGDMDDFVRRIDGRIVRNDYSVAHVSFNVDSGYRPMRHYRYWDYDPYDVGSVWVGCNFPGSEIWIDGVYYGISPLLIPQIVVGYHWIWMYYGGYPCYQRNFYVGYSQRFYIDADIDYHFRDYRYRHDTFHGWQFGEKKYRNDDGFIERSKQLRDNRVRTRALPAKIVRDYEARGVIHKDSQIIKRLGNDSYDRDSNNRVIKRGEMVKTPRENAPEVRSKADESNRTNDKGEVKRIWEGNRNYNPSDREQPSQKPSIDAKRNQQSDEGRKIENKTPERSTEKAAPSRSYQPSNEKKSSPKESGRESKSSRNSDRSSEKEKGKKR